MTIRDAKFRETIEAAYDEGPDGIFKAIDRDYLVVHKSELQTTNPKEGPQ